ncbi:MAG: DUF5399 family protein [Chlamydiota bacterium]|nr:DUF5399 family protein [Chlamydiota bacterium]
MTAPAPTTIDQLDISVNNGYAIRMSMIEGFNAKIHLDQATSIPTHTQILNYVPTPSELDLALGFIPAYASFAYFYPPKRFRFIRRSPFVRHRVAPSLGTLEEQEETETLLAEIECHTAKEKKEREILQKCFKQINQINEWLGYIVGNLGRLLQG